MLGCWILIMNDWFCIGTQALLCERVSSRWRVADSNEGKNLLDPLSYSDMERRNRRGWSCWRSPAETLSINGPRKPPPFSFKSLFFSPYVSIRKSISHPSAELNRGKKSNKKYPSRHRQEGGKMGDIESFFLGKETRKKRELENVFNWNAFQHILFFWRFLHHTSVPKGQKIPKETIECQQYDRPRHIKERRRQRDWINNLFGLSWQDIRADVSIGRVILNT
jgi:hypothetical protein